jgi:transcriptional regulator with XRE-family HTH domain
LNLEDSLQFSRSVIASLKRVRLARGISQERLAKMAGLSRTAITMMESRQRNPTLFVCHALATALDVPLSELLRAAEMKKQRKSKKRA